MREIRGCWSPIRRRSLEDPVDVRSCSRKWQSIAKQVVQSRIRVHKPQQPSWHPSCACPSLEISRQTPTCNCSCIVSHGPLHHTLLLHTLDRECLAVRNGCATERWDPSSCSIKRMETFVLPCSLFQSLPMVQHSPHCLRLVQEVSMETYK